MELIILIAGFIGGWLLFAGSIYQAALELHDEDVSREQFREVGKRLQKPKEISAWWWFIPPVKIYLESRRRNDFMNAYYAELNKAQTEALASYFNKSTGWLYVGVGGFLLACKETYELIEHVEFPMWVLPIVLFVLLIACVANTAIRIRRSEILIASKTDEPSPLV